MNNISKEYREIHSTLLEVASMLNRHKVFLDLFRHNWNRLEAFKNYLGYMYELNMIEITSCSDVASFPTFKIVSNYCERKIVVVQHLQLVLYEVIDNEHNKRIIDILDIYSLEDPQRITTWFQKVIGNDYTDNNMSIIEKDMDQYEMIKTFLSYDIYSLCKLDAVLKRLKDKILTYEIMEHL